MAKTVTALEQVVTTLQSDAYKRELTKLLPQAMIPRFVRVVQTVLRESPDLLNCDRSSLFGACIRAAQDGLLPDGKDAALVPYGNRAVYMPMVAGILKKIRNSGEVGVVRTKVVHENDEFEVWTDENGDHIKHRPAVGDQGKPRAVYAFAKVGEELIVEVMTTAEVETVRGMSKAKGGPAWTKFWGEMARKVVLRRLSKLLPTSAEVEEVIQRDDDDYVFVAEDTPKGNRLEKLVEAKFAPATKEKDESPL